MRTQGSKAREDLRLAIEALPRRARAAMLTAIESAPIIAGAYSDRDGICPMLAAHRAGGRSNVIGFALAWDRFAFGRSGRVRPRPATERELLVLKVYLQSSLLAGPVPAEEVEAGQARIDPAAASTRAPRDGGPQRDGWAWPRLVRAYVDYELELAQLEPEHRASAVELEPVLS
jgi:hypothetical protein